MFFLGRLTRWWFDRRRTIFKYYNGSRVVRSDPMVVGTRLEHECPDYYQILLLLRKKESEAPVGEVRNDLIRQKREAAEKLAAACMKVFELKPLDQTGGVTSGEAMGILTQFFVFMEELAAAVEVFPN